MTLTIESLFKTPGKTRMNNRGNTVKSTFLSADRYLFDFRLCPVSQGWIQYDTNQDAWYFGVWVNVERRKVVTYAEGDIYLVECSSLDTFRKELADMQDFYGDPPPMAIVFDLDKKTMTKVYDKNARPKV